MWAHQPDIKDVAVPCKSSDGMVEIPPRIVDNVPGSQTLDLVEARYPVRMVEDEVVARGEYIDDAFLHT